MKYQKFSGKVFISLFFGLFFAGGMSDAWAAPFDIDTCNYIVRMCASQYYPSSYSAEDLCEGAYDMDACIQMCEDADNYGVESVDVSNYSQVCEYCEAGYFYDENMSVCTKCSAGTYTLYPNVLLSCSVCQAGTYSAAGASGCTSCAAGTYASGTGNASCTNCAAGYYASGTGNTTCTPCEAGSYAYGTGNKSCKLCVEGSYQDLTGQSQCKDCTDGYYSDIRGATACTKCPQYLGIDASSAYEDGFHPDLDDYTWRDSILSCHFKSGVRGETTRGSFRFIDRCWYR